MSNLYRQDYEPPKVSRGMKVEHRARHLAFEAGAWLIFITFVSVVILKATGQL